MANIRGTLMFRANTFTSDGDDAEFLDEGVLLGDAKSLMKGVLLGDAELLDEGVLLGDSELPAPGKLLDNDHDEVPDDGEVLGAVLGQVGVLGAVRGQVGGLGAVRGRVGGLGWQVGGSITLFFRFFFLKFLKIFREQNFRASSLSDVYSAEIIIYCSIMNMCYLSRLIGPVFRLVADVTVYRRLAFTGPKRQLHEGQGHLQGLS